MCIRDRELCDQHHYKKRFAPYIHVIRITQKDAGWTAKRFSARFRDVYKRQLAARWRALPCPVIGRIYDGRLWLDLRCLEDETRFMEMLLR